jgi:hypothetical protein
MMRLWSHGKGVRAQRPTATPVGGLQAGHAEIIDLVADGVMGWAGHPADDAFQPVDPYLIELGWRAWYCMVEENILGQMGFPDHLVSLLEGGMGW